MKSYKQPIWFVLECDNKNDPNVYICDTEEMNIGLIFDQEQGCISTIFQIKYEYFGTHQNDIDNENIAWYCTLWSILWQIYRY